MSIWSDPTSAVPAAKTNAQTPTGAGTEWAAEDANKIRQALLDIGQGLASGSVTATGTTVGRSLGNRFADVVNVKDFGAVGDGVADDTGAIQAALNVALPTAKELFIPAGTYLVTSALILGNASTPYWVCIRGEGYSSKVTGNFAGYILDRNLFPGEGVGGPHYIDDLWVNNDHASGGGIRFKGAVQARLSGLRVNAKSYGVFAEGNTFSLTIEGCLVQGTGTGIGLMLGGHTTVSNCDITGWSDGIRASGAGITVLGGRFEVNTNAIHFGRDSANGQVQAHSWSIVGSKCEANDTSVRLHYTTSGSIIGLNVQGTTNSPSGQSLYGIYVNTNVGVTVSGALINGTFSSAGVYVAPTPGGNSQVTFVSSIVQNSYGGGSLYWDDSGSKARYLNCDASAPVERFPLLVSADHGDASDTLQAGVDAPIQRWDTTLSQNRTVTLSTTGAVAGDSFRIVRTGLGSFTLDVGGLKTIPSATAAFVDVVYNGSAWGLTGYGTL